MVSHIPNKKTICKLFSCLSIVAVIDMVLPTADLTGLTDVEADLHSYPTPLARKGVYASFFFMDAPDETILVYRGDGEEEIVARLERDATRGQMKRKAWAYLKELERQEG